MSDYFQRLKLRRAPRPTLDAASMIRANIGRDYWRVGVDYIPSTLAHRQALLDYVEGISTHDRAGVGAYLHGELGTGKTAAGVILLKAAMARGASAYLITGAEAQRDLIRRPDWKTPLGGCPFEEMLRNVHFLLLDDFGGEDDASWKAPELEMVVRSRQRDRLPTIITSNYPPSAAKWPWFVSLLRKHYLEILVTGINWRATV